MANDQSEMAACRRVDRLEEIPEPVPTGEFVVVDVIISSTSIVRLLEEGAEYVKPFGDPDAALEFKTATDDALLVGEDGGGPIDGFDLSPLPSIISDADVADRPVGIRTSNGTRAMDRIGHTEGLLVGSTVNAAAVASELTSRATDSLIVAAGRQGEPTPEDTVGAELI
jgi:2-phosphosulfolactate phosphatase